MTDDLATSNSGADLFEVVPDPATTAGPVRTYQSLFELVADATRRNVLLTLASKGDDVVSLDDLVTGVLDADTCDDRDREDVSTALYHVHLPELADVGLIEYDWRSGSVRYRGDESLERLFGTCYGDA